MLLEDKPIAFYLFGIATNFFNSKGYIQIEVPWIISSKASMTTSPSIQHVYHADLVREHFIGSAEQGFIQLIYDQSPKLKPDEYYFAISPCFRRDKPDELHSRWFMKLELFALLPNMRGNDVVAHFKRDAATLHKFLFDVDMEFAANGDLEFNGIEYGSYGIREIGKQSYVYGTGLALPRAQLLFDYSETE